MAKKRKKTEEPKETQSEGVEAKDESEELQWHMDEETVEAAPEIPEQEEKPEPPKSEKPVLNRVSFAIFESASGIKFDQLAGFKRWVKIQNLGPRSMQDWRKALDEYNKRPVR